MFLPAAGAFVLPPFVVAVFVVVPGLHEAPASAAIKLKQINAVRNFFIFFSNFTEGLLKMINWTDQSLKHYNLKITAKTPHCLIILIFQSILLTFLDSMLSLENRLTKIG